MRFLRTNTAVRLTVGPFFDKTDGVTPETSITVTSCKLTLMVDDANVPTLVLDTAPTASGGANDMVHVTGDDAGFYDLELAAANVNYLGRAMLAITDAAVHCPVFHEFMILPAMIYDSLVLGTDRLDANVTHVADTSQTARDLGATLGAAGAGLTAVPWNAAWDAEVESEANDALIANNLDHLLLSAVPTNFQGAVHDDSVIGHMTSVSDANSFNRTTDSLEAFENNGLTVQNIVDGVWNEPLAGHLDAGSTGLELSDAGGAGTPPTAAAIADAVWDEDATAHQTQGSFGQAIGDPAADANTIFKAVVTDAAGANVAADIVAVKAETVAILADTNELQTDWVNGGRLDNILDARASQTSVDDLPTNAELATALDAIPTAAENAAGVLDLAAGIETGLTLRQAMRLIAAASAGKLSGAETTTIVIRNAVADSKPRITATVDGDGNRTAITADVT